MSESRFPEMRVEVALAALVAVATGTGVRFELTYSPYPVPPAVGGYLLAAASAAVLVFRRRRPVLVAWLGVLIVLAYRQLGYPGAAPALGLFVSIYTVTAYGHRLWRDLTACGLLVLAAWAVPALPPHAQPWYSFALTGPAFGLAWMAVLGAATGTSRRAAAQSLRRAATATEARMREGLAEERLRIARELHDVLAHTISVIAVQSGLALDSLDDRPGQARTALLAVRAATREAMPELRAALGLLRGDRPAGGQPVGSDALAQPRLEQLPDLADQARAAGLRVDLSVTQPPQSAPLPPFLDLTGYRIVQEALTNVVRHAHANAVSVTVTREDGTLLIEVRDDGRGAPTPPASGLGLAGMRERVALVGGTVTAGPAAGGGFRVSARLPVELS